MTPDEIETAARRKYNSSSSSFFSSLEIYDLIYQAECEIARETKMIEEVTTVASGTFSGVQAYSYPLGAMEIRRVECNGQVLERITFNEDDELTLFNSNTTELGTPAYYFDWHNAIYLRPVPSSSGLEIKVYYLMEPTRVTTPSQTLEIPSIFHMCIVDYVTAEFAAKDLNFQVAEYYKNRWDAVHMPAMKRWVRQKRSSNKFQTVKDINLVSSSGLRNT